MRKQLIILMSLILLCGCSMQGNGNGTTSQSSGTSSTTQTTEAPGISSIWGMMDYMGNRGLTYSGISEIGDLNEGYNYGMSFQHNGGNYQLYQYDTNNTTMTEVVDSIKKNHKVQLQVNGEYVELPAYVYQNYILIYPEGTDISEIEGYFR